MSTPEKERKKKEDEYFARLEFERKKKLLEEQQKTMQSAEKQKLKELHWMRCPKCGMEMVEIDFEGIRVDKCSACLGVFFDNGGSGAVDSKEQAGLPLPPCLCFQGMMPSAG